MRQGADDLTPKTLWQWLGGDDGYTCNQASKSDLNDLATKKVVALRIKARLPLLPRPLLYADSTVGSPACVSSNLNDPSQNCRPFGHDPTTEVKLKCSMRSTSGHMLLTARAVRPANGTLSVCGAGHRRRSRAVHHSITRAQHGSRSAELSSSLQTWHVNLTFTVAFTLTPPATLPRSHAQVHTHTHSWPRAATGADSQVTDSRSRSCRRK